MKGWEIIADNLKKLVGAWAGCQPLIAKAEQSRLPTRSAATTNVIFFAYETH
jgi:hypothetical protein